MINFRNTQFIKSSNDKLSRPNDNLKEVLFVGRSNVGKSSLLNCLCNNKNLAFVSSKPGHTKLLNYYNVDKKFYLVDAPGYGFSFSNKDEINFFAKLMENYFTDNKFLSFVVFLLDSRRKINQDDLDIYSFLKSENIPFIVVLTKADKINQKEKHAILKEIKNNFDIVEDDLIFTSTYSNKNLDMLKKIIEVHL